MRVRKIFFAFFLMSMLSCEIYSQSLSKAEANYVQFNKLRASNDKASMYNALYHSYEEYAKVLNASTINSSSYSVSKQALKDIFQYLPSGAAWSQSKGQQVNCIMFAQAYIDITLMEAFKGDILPKSENHAALAHIAAAGAYNARKYDKAVLYLCAYLESGDQRKREECYRSLIEAYIKLNKINEAVATITEAIKYYPNNKNLLDLGISNAMVTEDWDNLQFFLDKALAANPNDLSYLDAQGKLYEKRNDFQKALTVYNKLNKLKPQNLDINKHLALDYYNLGVDYFNKAIMEQGSSAEKKYKRQANEYFSAAAPILENVIANDPTAAGHTRALGIVYNCIGEKEKRDEVNDKLMAFNMQPVSDNTIPQVIGFDLNYRGNPNPVPQPEPMPTDFAKYQKKYVEDNYVRWYSQSQFETDEEYKERVNDENCKKKAEELNEEAMKKYIAQHVKKVTHKDLSLGQYDPNNQTYMITSDYGNMVIKVPRAKKESEIFYSTWVGMQFKDPTFYIDNNYKIRLSSLTFVTPAGKSYQYNRSEKEIAYVPIVHSGDIFIPDVPRPRPEPEPQPQPRNDYPSSDVDVNIPETKAKNDNTFAFIIANEKYDVVSKVDYANNDGKIFAEYCKKTLGLPTDNVKLNENATYGKMLQTIRLIKKTAEYNANANIILYYAGHGIPNDETKDAFLLPIDADGKQTEGCYSLNRLFKELGELKARQVVVFLDACFSGAKRDGGMLASVRGVAIKSKAVEATGNMVVFSAADGEQTALPWQERGHGLFTYFLLKKLQESKGKVKLKELGDYLKENVSKIAINKKQKEQTPTIRASVSLGNSWEERTLQ